MTDSEQSDEVSFDPREQRVRFLGCEVERSPGSRLRVRVSLEVGDERVEAELQDTGGDVVELRLAAEATLVALQRGIPGVPAVELVGVKSVHAFDVEAIMVRVRTEAEPDRRLFGCVPVEDGAARAAAVAALDAVNRILGRAAPG